LSDRHPLFVAREYLRRAGRFSGMSSGETGYMLCAIALCVVLVGAHVSGGQLEQVERQDTWAALAAGRDVAEDPFAAAVQGRDIVSAAQIPSDRNVAPAALPTWVQAVRSTRLWADPWDGEASGNVRQWQFLKVVGAERARFRVEGTALEGGGVEGWIDLDDCGLSGPPSQWVRTARFAILYGDAAGETAVQVPPDVDLLLIGDTAADRLYVYRHSEIASGRTDYGWVEAEAVVPSVAPPDVALPSPAFRAVPFRRAGTYRVRLGDTLASIEEAFGLKSEELIRLNGLDTRGHLLVGQLLQLGGARDVGQTEGPGPRRVREISPGWISAEHAVVIDADSGQILWAREANVPIPPASLTKILTAMLVLDHANLTDPVTVQVDSRRMPGSTVMGLHPGDTLTVEDLLYGMMLASGNDAALALAHHVAGTSEAFAGLMNEKVRSLGLTGSHFANPHGLDAPGHMSTALDMAILAREAMVVPLFRELSAARDYETPRGRGYVVYNLNQLLWRYQGADGVKIGYTPAAGRAIVASATRDGRRVYVAMMRSNDIYADSAALLDWAFASYSWQ